AQHVDPRGTRGDVSGDVTRRAEPVARHGEPRWRSVASMPDRRGRVLGGGRAGEGDRATIRQGAGVMARKAATEKAGPARRRRVTNELLVKPGKPANIAGRDTRWSGGGSFDELSSGKLDAAAKKILARGIDELADAQELLWASGDRSVLIVFQAMDAAGKDSTIKHVMSGVNPQGVDVVSFKKPSAAELDHAYLWRISNAAPARGRIGIFNRSHYEEVVALRVHPEWL